MLDYVALGLLFFVILVMFYGVIVVHDIPYEIAVERNHPQQDAIHVAGWISLFTLGAIWPFLWIWATLYKEDIGWGFQSGSYKDLKPGTAKNLQSEVDELKTELSVIKQLLNQQQSKES